MRAKLEKRVADAKKHYRSLKKRGRSLKARGSALKSWIETLRRSIAPLLKSEILIAILLGLLVIYGLTAQFIGWV